ncbi:hypothetical protein ACYSNL_06710 [Enterococcus cecorum]
MFTHLYIPCWFDCSEVTPKSLTFGGHLRRQEGEKIGEEKGIKKGARNVIIEFKANQAAPSFIFQFVKNAYRGKLTDEEIQQMIDEVEENE